MKVQEVMAREVWICRPEDSLERAAEILWEKDCGVVAVVSPDRRPVGMLTDRDVCMACYFKGQPLASLGVASAMARTVHSCHADDTLVGATVVMQQHQVHRLPVIDADGRLVGIVSLCDLVRVAAQAEHRADLPAEDVLQTLARICEPRAAQRVQRGDEIEIAREPEREITPMAPRPNPESEARPQKSRRSPSRGFEDGAHA